MADDLADYPIVVLENDFPERAGKLGLFDLLMPVGNTGIKFTAAMPGILQIWGVQFTDEVVYVANLRAATTLIQMGLVRGESFTFIRQALRMTQQEVADLYQVSLSTEQGWESNTVQIPITVWECLSFRACVADKRVLPPLHQLPNPSWRPRLIRVFPELPMQSQQQSGPACPCPNPPNPVIPGADCYPPKRC